MMMRTRLAGIAIIMLATAAGCPGEIDDPARFTSCPPGGVEQMFQARCTGALGTGCHTASTPDAELDLVSPGVGARVRGLSSVAICEGRPLVDAENGMHLLVDKVLDTPGCGSRMPLGEAALSPNEVECLRRWVDELAEGP